MSEFKDDWHSYAGSPGSARFRESEISRVDSLRLKMEEPQWELPIDNTMLSERENTQFGPNEGTPLKIDNALFTVCAPSLVAKFDLDTMSPAKTPDGQPVIFDPELYRQAAPEMIGFLHRGLTYWKQGERERIFLACGDATLKALDRNLVLINEFGVNGSVDVAPNPAPRLLTMTSPPAICGDVVIVGSAIGDLNETRRPAVGEVRAFNAVSGVPLWTFETIPSGNTILGESIEDDWADGANQTSGHANVWAPMSVDEEAGLVYLPVSGSYNDAYGGNRPGNNRHAQSLVAIEAKTGHVRWEFQLVKHDLWDYDPPAAPVLVDITDNGTVRKLVVQVTKQGYAYIFDRHTGEPRWPIEDCAVPSSNVPGEITAVSQPVPTKPKPFDHQGLYTSDGVDLLGNSVAANINSLSETLRNQILVLLDNYQYGSLFTPPSELTGKNRGTIQYPGFLGGASWAGAVADPGRQRIYVSSVTQGHVSAVKYNKSAKTHFSAGYESWGVPCKYPLVGPPWGRITAIDLASGEHLWQQAVGDGPRSALEEEFKDIDLPDGELGWPRRIHLLGTTNVLFAAQEAGREVTGLDPESRVLQYKFNTDKPQLRAYDPDTGALLAAVDLPMNAQGALMHFRHAGREFIAVPVGGFDLPAKIVIVGIEDLSARATQA